MVENGVKPREGFYAGGNTRTFTWWDTGHSEGDIMDVSCDCRSCLGSDVESAKSTCGDSISGQFYFSKCYISYRYYPNGVSMSTSSGTRGGGKRGIMVRRKQWHGGVWCLAAFGFGTACLMFALSHFKRREVKCTERIEY